MDNTSGVKSEPDPLIGQVDFDNWADFTNEEDVVNKYFYKLYISEITTDQMIEVMKHLSSSPKDSRNKSVYNTMLKILFNECRFFPKYPLQELSITAELFGKMIKHGLLLSNGPLLLLASRCILESLKRGKTSKMFQFGTIALSQFENSIASYPWFSNSLLSIPDVKETFPQLYKTCEKLQTIMTDTMKNSTYIDQSKGIVIGQAEEALQSSSAQGAGQATSQSQSQSQTQPKANTQAYGLDVRSSVGEWELIMGDVEIDVKVPPDTLVDHVYSIFNNMCPDDVEKKAKEISSLLNKDYNSWLLLYIIRTRASKEHNLHDVFANFIEHMNYPKLFDLAIQITYLCINSCLKSVEQFKEVLAYRTLLKNLGSWLGRITLYRNVPIIHRNLDIKAVLIKGYENGYLIAVLPFICKSMESIKGSKIFKPPNPWTTAILSFLMEIRNLPNLKTNLVFEVEVLFRHLNLEMSDYANKTAILSSKNPPQNSSDFDTPNSGTSAAGTGVGGPGTTSSTLSGLAGIKGHSMLSAQTNHLAATTVPTSVDRERLNQLLSKVIREGTIATTTGSTVNTGTNQNVAAGSAQANVGGNINNVVSQAAANGSVSVPVGSSNTQPGGSTSVNLPNTSNFAHNQINMSMARYVDNMIHNLHNSVVISPSIALFEIQPQFRALVPVAIERAVRHVLSVVCDHSLSLARMCTKVLIAKDFANEEDENVTRAATRMMFESISTNLVVATCKEPLRLAFHESLRTSLQTHRTQDCNDQVLVEQLVQILSQDNLGICVNVVEKITQEYAVRESDLLFMEILKSIHREPKIPHNFLPTVLSNWNTKNKSQQALATYKTIFNGTQVKPLSTTQSTAIPPHSPPTMPIPPNSVISPQLQPQAMATQSRQMPAQLSLGIGSMASPPNQLPATSTSNIAPTNGLYSVLTVFEECLSDLREPLRDISLFPPPFYNTGLEPGRTAHIFSTQSLRILYSLPHDHEIFSCIIKCLNVVETSGSRELASLAIAKCLLMFVCEGPGSHTGLNVEVVLCILDGLNSINPGVKQLLGNMLFSLPLDQSNNLFNIMVVTGLLRYRLLEWTDLTHYFILAMERGKNMYAIEMAIVATAIALIDQKSAPPTVGSSLVREISTLNCGTEQCKTHPGVLIEEARVKLLKDIVEAQSDPNPKPTIMVLTTILKQNLNTKIGLQYFKDGTATALGSLVSSDIHQLLELTTETKCEDPVEGFGGARRVPRPIAVNESQKFLFGVLFGQWIECSRNVEGDALLFAWRQFFQKFNLQAFFKMEGGTDSFFASCLYTIIQFEKSSKLFKLATNTSSININTQNIGSENTSGLTKANVAPKNNESSSSTPSDARSSASSTSSKSHSITLYECFEGLCKMVDVMLRLVGGVGEIPPCSALQKLLSCLSSIIVHEGHYFRSYNIWLSLMVYFDRFEENNYVFSKLTFLYALEYVNPTRVPGFAFFFLRLLVHPSLLTGSLKASKCWPALARIFNLLSIYTTEINSYSSYGGEVPENGFSGGAVNALASILGTNVASGTGDVAASVNGLCKEYMNRGGEREGKELEMEREVDYVEYFTCVYFNSIEYVASLCPEFVTTNYLNFFGTFAIERLASSVGSGAGLPSTLGMKGVDLLPEMKVIPKVSNSWTNHISRNRTSLLVSKILNTLAKNGPSSLPTCQDLENLCLILTEESSNTPAQSVLTFNSLTMEIVTNYPNSPPELLESNARLLLFLWLVKTLPLRAKYQLVCSITRHLRTPNAHTFFFSCLIITIFEECKNDSEVTQVILRVLLESFIAPGQCPWGVSLVVVELFRNPRFQLTPNYSPQTNALIDSITHTINNIVV